MQRKLGLSAVLALVVGDMIGSGIFFTPGELASVADAEWQVYFFWALCGLITLCGALTLAEIATLLPRPGVYYHALNEAYGPFAGFLQGWVQMLVSGPGSVAGIAILFGELATQVIGTESSQWKLAWGSAAILFFAGVNLRGADWGARTQIVLTVAKLLGLLALIAGGILIAQPAQTEIVAGAPAETFDLAGTVRFIGLGVAVVLFTYDGWIDATHVAGEVRNPRRNFPIAMGVGVALITVVYLLVNFAFLRVVPLAQMRAEPTLVATTVAEAAFGPGGGAAVSVLMWISIFGALGGLVMALPRLFYATVSDYADRSSRTVFTSLFKGVSYLSPHSAVPAGAIVYTAAAAIIALVFFGSFSKIVSFVLVPLQFINILLVASVFRLRGRISSTDAFRTPGYPVVPGLFIAVMSMFLISALVFNPRDSLIGIGLMLAGIPVYRSMRGSAAR